ncbi:flagellar protein FliT [Planococcus salinus]|uniref:Flagellar protein FliT n=1 Tax=Planococcus salinus TaxID=1848460 RepID=A0A3M8P585_9BACL|nr:flagellar protein FliT [Planococcus salinus]RNF38772.1 flagellar protein FliT [Planococcus salinus]
MEQQHDLLQQLLELTEAILEKAQTIGSKMEDNQVEDLVELQLYFDKRQEVIDRLEASRNESAFDWSPEGQEKITQLQASEQQLIPLMTQLHQAFAGQMNRINQTKQLSKKYRGAYQSAPSDGTFFDRRK